MSNSGVGVVKAALASALVAEDAFQAAGGCGALLTVGGKSTGAILSEGVNNVCPTTLARTGGIRLRP